MLIISICNHFIYLLILILMYVYKQKQPGCSCRKRTLKCRFHNRNQKKNKQIIQTYLANPQTSSRSTVYELIDKSKLQAVRRKDADQYLIINPNVNYGRRAKTENHNHQELEEEYIKELKNVKKQIKNLQEDITKKKTVYLQPLPLYNQHIRSPFRHQQKTYTPLQQQYPKRGKSFDQYFRQDIQNLQNQVRQLRRQMTINKRFNSPLKLPSINSPMKFNKDTQYQTGLFTRANYMPRKIDTVFVPKPQSIMRSINQSRWLKKSTDQTLRKIKKVVNAVFFLSYLRQFSEKVRTKRQNYFKQSFQQNVYNQINILKTSFIKSTSQFFLKLPVAQNPNLVISSTDNQKQRQIKKQLTKKYLNQFLDIIGQAQFSPTTIKALTQTCYYICRHGGVGITSSYFTSEQLDIMCVSKKYMRICAQKYLQKSQISVFLWIKLIAFNILLRGSQIQELKIQQNSIWNCNLFLLGSLIYQISRNIQANLIEKVPLSYTVGNWKHINFLASKSYHTKKTIIPCKSMTISIKPFEKILTIQEDPNQLIKGTLSKSYLSQAYQFQIWQIQQRKIANLINFIHKKMCKYHAKLKQQLQLN